MGPTAHPPAGLSGPSPVVSRGPWEGLCNPGFSHRRLLSPYICISVKCDASSLRSSLFLLPVIWCLPGHCGGEEAVWLGASRLLVPQI